MYGNVNTSEFPRINDFQDAARYMRDTKPMQRGPSKGVVPLRTIKRDARNYSIRLDSGEHPVTGVVDDCYVATMYATDIVIWWPDGTIQLHDYNSLTTNKAQTALTPFDVVSHRGDKAIMLPLNYFDPVMDMTFFTGDLAVSAAMEAESGYSYPRSIHRRVVILFPVQYDSYLTMYRVPIDGRMGNCYRPLDYGVYVGPGRKYHRKIDGQLIRAAQKACRSFAAFATNDPHLLNTIEGTTEVESLGGPANARWHVDDVVKRYDWSPGKPVTGPMLNALMSPSRGTPDGGWQGRFEWATALRMVPRTTTNTVGWRDGRSVETIVSKRRAEEMCIDIEELSGQPVF